MRFFFCIITFLSCANLATAQEHYKYTDQNGIVTWLEDKSKILPPLPVYHRYQDQNGLVFWVDDANKIPQQYRNAPELKNDIAEKVKAGLEPIQVEKTQYGTRISIINNVIIVPVVFRNKGRRVKARMILDTGASVTTLYSALAAKLNLGKNKLTMVKSVNANGMTSDSLLTKVDYMEVDDKILSNAEVVVIPLHGNIGADGLLGNSFLRFFNFTIDYEKQLLRWH